MSQPNIQAELEELKDIWEKTVSLVSNCCASPTTEPDKNGLSRCLDCKEGCAVEPEWTFEDWLCEEVSKYRE